MRCAILRSRSGEMARSSAATMYQSGLLLHAGDPTRDAFNAAAAAGPWVAKSVSFSFGVSCCAKSSEIAFSVTLRKPELSGRSSLAIGVGGPVARGRKMIHLYRARTQPQK